eukprot:TRINITY_DN66672_c2_g1_i1.p1 TRINITY_DN66672_c2_g1~~TRINITY_DN66672_c2_g1_i1.p1  ORF type:complete len:184 (-),score=7.34 TRINITY_DN66672_c2_g1_i1:54-605(-)
MGFGPCDDRRASLDCWQRRDPTFVVGRLDLQASRGHRQCRSSCCCWSKPWGSTQFMLAGLSTTAADPSTSTATTTNSKFHTASDGSSSGSASITYERGTGCFWCDSCAFGGSWSKSCTNARYTTPGSGAVCTLTADCKDTSGGTKTTSFSNSHSYFSVNQDGTGFNRLWYPTANLANIDGTLQ